MISPDLFFNFITEMGTTFFAGVPDSSLKYFCEYISEHVPKKDFFICANEGAAVGMATGHYLATGQVPVVYMQNSGIGNAVNPLLSIADSDVYSIPVLLIIGWRGEPGKKDEPQHKKQGRVLLQMLETMEIPFIIIDDNEGNAKQAIKAAYGYMAEKKSPFALVVKKGSFEPYKKKENELARFDLIREVAVKQIIDSLDSKDIVISTTGMTSREVFEYREFLGHGHEKDFLVVGGMGHTSQIALGIAIKKQDRVVICLDGDGSIIMHMGAMAINGIFGSSNFVHIVLNNGAHDSVGGQPTVGHEIDFLQIAKACKYRTATKLEKKAEITAFINKIKTELGPHFIEISLRKGSRDDIGRPTTDPMENKKTFMQFVQER